MRTYSWAIVLAAVLAGGPAGAVDINSLGPVQQKRYCLAYMYLAGAMVDSGAKRNRVMKADIDVFAKLAEEGFDR
jgi:hypothetical protein